MAFSVNYGRRGAVVRPRSAPLGISRFLTISAILFGMFCIYDYSPYGEGYVAVGLGAAQRAFQDFMTRFRVRL